MKKTVVKVKKKKKMKKTVVKVKNDPDYEELPRGGGEEEVRRRRRRRGGGGEEEEEEERRRIRRYADDTVLSMLTVSPPPCYFCLFHDASTAEGAERRGGGGGGNGREITGFRESRQPETMEETKMAQGDKETDKNEEKHDKNDGCQRNEQHAHQTAGNAVKFGVEELTQIGIIQEFPTLTE
ncbi:Hypothetical predicted protein [Xyrichtys novacula]|uniref:Uncharacterized protein n=1 Tax=Xyrichtys novacula TaxID=13765 RepID=A0AAV1EZV5_XYRNO|nr:Hypothetical predicted protein [Xyrichtys novacula]